MLSCFRHRGMYVYINLYHATHLASTMVFIPIFSKCWYAQGSGLVFVMYILLNDRTWNRPLLWLLSRHLSLAQQYLGRVNREVAFRSQWVRSPGLSALRWAGALSIIRNVCSSWLSRRLTSIKNALKSSLFIPPIWAVWFTQKKSWHFYQADRQPDDTLILQLQSFHHRRPRLIPPPIYPS